MARIAEEERDKLRGAAETAISVLQRLRMERAEIDAKIGRFEAVVQVYEEALGRKPRPASDDGTEARPLRHKKGSAAAQVDAVLGGGADYDLRELGRVILDRSGVHFPRTTLLAVLRRGREAGKYERKEGRWRVKAV